MLYHAYYAKPEVVRGLLMGYDFAVESVERFPREKVQLPDLADLSMTHTLVAPVWVTDEELDDDQSHLGLVYVRMQGEMWSPRGEARPLIKALGLSHTSMCTGDIIVDAQSGAVWFVEMVGFKMLGTMPSPVHGEYLGSGS